MGLVGLWSTAIQRQIKTQHSGSFILIAETGTRNIQYKTVQLDLSTFAHMGKKQRQHKR